MAEEEKQSSALRTREEVLSETYVQLKFLKQECMCYDAGDADYGRQIAVKLRVLLHESRDPKSRSRSILQQLESQFLFDRPDFLDLSSVGGDLPNKGTTEFVRASLCQYRMDHDIDSPPVLTALPLIPEKGKHYPLRAFRTWWERLDVVLLDRTRALQRCKVVGLLADKEGGAHVDAKLGDELAMLKRREALPFRIVTRLPDGRQKEYIAQTDQILAACVRTIAEETLFVFENKILPYCAARV